ncbi:MAG: hypothetical protein GX085_00300 [Firmicutes bacterium]|nr:hypothetical protein [Bacillota bacterium]
MALLFPGCRSTKVESKTGQYDEIEVASGFLLLSNMWGTVAATDQKICLYDDGSYGWEWERGDSGVSNPNYPEIIYGVKPWGQGVAGGTLYLPKQLKDINSLLMELDFDYKVTVTNETGWWCVTVELYLTSEKPTPGQDLSGTIFDEVMIYFDWKGEPVGSEQQNHIEDEGYSYVWTTMEDNWGNGWRYSQFRIREKGKIPEKVNLKLFLDFIKDTYGRSGDLWLGAVEFGMMYYDHTAGHGLVKKLDYIINGERVSSGRR